MVSKPTFNPATIDADWDSLLKMEDEGVFFNRAVQPGIYPPGSTLKIIVAGEALQNIKDIQSKTYTDNGTLKIGSYTLSNYNHESHGSINIHDALVVSSNVVFGQIGMELGADRLKNGAEDFYFNKNIDFDLAVAQSQFPAIDKSRQDSLAQSSIGQYEVRVTPLQMLLAVSTIANKGVMMKPYLVRSITDPYGWKIKNTSPESMAQPLTSETTDILKSMMVDVVKKGTGKKAQIQGIDVAGKTGTAEVGGDLAPHSWFVAFAPADDPKIAISIIVENGETGGGKAAAISKDLIKLYLNK
jgi:peptidoglycan glycosyltransferase